VITSLLLRRKSKIDREKARAKEVLPHGIPGGMKSRFGKRLEGKRRPDG
jgi:hypothetical protein